MKREDLKKFSDRLKQERDELRVQLDLAKMEARDEWAELEQKWEHFRGKVKVVQDEADDVGSEAAAAAGLLADEIKKGYARLRDLI